MGYRPHPQKRMKNHSLATARSFVGYRPHPPLAPTVYCGALERTPPRLIAVRAACRPRRSPCSLALGRLSARTAGASASGFATCRWCHLQPSPCTTSGTRNLRAPQKPTKNHSFVPIKRHSHRSWATAHTRISAEEVIRSLPLAHSWAPAHTRTSA